jgi:hypothetical protein
LSSGEQVTGDDIASNKWDIAFKRSRLIFTNSGVTADDLSSHGQGGVWHTDKTDFDAVTLADKKTDAAYQAYYTDVTRWIPKSGGGAAESALNIMTFNGYTTGDGLSEDTFFEAPVKYDQKQYYKATPGAMPPTFEATEQVYIILHGDGAHHSKIQVVSYESDTTNMAADGGADKYIFRYKNLD